MSKYISWINVISLWCMVALFASLYLGTYSSEKRVFVAALIAFLTAYNVSDIICRYQVIKGKDR